MTHQEYLVNWHESQDLAEQMLPLLGKLYRNQGIEIQFYGRPMINATTIDIIKAHRVVRRYAGHVLPLKQSYLILEAIAKMELSPAHIDLGKLAVEYWDQHEGAEQIEEFLGTKLEAISSVENIEPQDVVLYGFGRIGRLLARLMIDQNSQVSRLRLRAIVTRSGGADDLEKRASLLRRDSVHGPFNGSIYVDQEKNAIVANGNYIQLIHANSPQDIDYTQYGISNALVVDNTGKWRDREGLGLHLESKGVSKVLLTAPGKGDIKNIVHGVNHSDVATSDQIISAASCTTNAITPVLKAINDKYGILNGHVETVHSYTNDQNLIDNYHKGDRRGRSAALNMVLTETGAATAVAKALPELEGKLTGNSIRVPTPNVSMAIMNLNLNEATDKQSLNDYLKETALNSELQDQIDYTTSTELVSSDMVGSRFAGIVDSQATIVSDNRAVLYVWYDNEFGYSNQVVRVMQEMCGLHIPHLPLR